jgi:lipopolysaccharide transport system permease protein
MPEPDMLRAAGRACVAAQSWVTTLPSLNTIVLDADRRAAHPYIGAWHDLVRGFGFMRLWGTMGWLDISQRYRRSVVGPLWITASLGLFVMGLSVTYGALFNMTLRDYIPYIAVGMIVWTLLSSFLAEGCTSFISAEASIKQMPAPVCIHVLRVIARSLIMFAHNFVIYVAVLLIFGIWPGWNGLLAIPGLIVVIANGIGFGLTLGTLSARFRDIPPLMSNLIQMMFFVTPILWRPESLGSRGIIAHANPIYHLIEIVRLPLLGEAPGLTSWALAGAFTIANLGLAFYIYARLRWRIPYWL